MAKDLLQKEEKLVQWFKKHRKVLIALSGGVDSCLLAYVARKTNGKINAISVIAVSPSLKQKDLRGAQSFCADNDIQLLEIYPNEIEDVNYSSNPINRCFFCKTALYDEMQNLKKLNYPDYFILNGNNTSDLGDYRPGMEAAKNYSVFSPLADCGFEKEDIRELARKYELVIWDKPASPCLSSRFPYGEKITIEKLKMVENAEEVLNNYGFSDVRVRYYNNQAKIEVPISEVSILENKIGIIKNEIKSFGFTACEIDSEGLVSGKLNQGINNQGNN